MAATLSAEIQTSDRLVSGLRNIQKYLEIFHRNIIPSYYFLSAQVSVPRADKKYLNGFFILSYISIFYLSNYWVLSGNKLKLLEGLTRSGPVVSTSQ